MLPPDTSSSLLPWRVMVPLMQVYGAFPYRMSATSAAPVFSLPLCLWSIFINFCVISWNCSFDILSEDLTKDVGSVAFIFSTVILMVALSLAPIVLAVKSNVLATLLHDMSGIKGVSPPPTYRWYCKVNTLALLLSATVFLIAMAWITCVTVGFSIVIAIVFITPTSFIYCLGLLLPMELPAMVFGLLARRLLVATETTVATVSSLLAHDGSLQHENDAEAAMVELRDLEAVIREVEVLREKGTRCFFQVITMFLLLSIILAIVCPYIILRGKLMGGNTVLMLLTAYYIMARFCHLGQAFVNQVSAAKGFLKDLRLKSQNLNFNIKVKHVMGSLSPLLTFDVCGWYTLSYSTFIGLNNTIMTYVVIIFQMGGMTFEKLLTSSHTNSSAST